MTKFVIFKSSRKNIFLLLAILHNVTTLVRFSIIDYSRGQHFDKSGKNLEMWINNSGMKEKLVFRWNLQNITENTHFFLFVCDALCLLFLFILKLEEVSPRIEFFLVFRCYQLFRKSLIFVVGFQKFTEPLIKRLKVFKIRDLYKYM